MRLNAVASSFLALSDSESAAGSGRQKEKHLIGFVHLYLYRGASFSFGITSLTLVAARSLSCSCTAVERLARVLPASLWRRLWNSESSSAVTNRAGSFHSLAGVRSEKNLAKKRGPILHSAPFFCGNGNAHKRERTITFDFFFFLKELL